MTQPTTYTKQHYEDVARIIEDTWLSTNAGEIIRNLANDFADLFAADNPKRCRHCTMAPTFKMTPCVATAHHYEGFNRADFLAACGLETS